jgi:hypothetical protein
MPEGHSSRPMSPNAGAMAKWVLGRGPLREDAGEVGLYRPRSPHPQRAMKNSRGKLAEPSDMEIWESECSRDCF